MAQTLAYFMAFSIIGGAVIALIIRLAQAFKVYRDALLLARAHIVNLQAQVKRLEADNESGLEYSIGLLKDLQEAQQGIRNVSDEDLPGFVQAEVARRVWMTVSYGADPIERAKLASKVGGKCFRIMDAAKRNPERIGELAIPSLNHKE